jgi:hypothetical protein
LVERAIAAINARDIEGYLACLTENVKLETPMAAGAVDQLGLAMSTAYAMVLLWAPRTTLQTPSGRLKCSGRISTLASSLVKRGELLQL